MLSSTSNSKRPTTESSIVILLTALLVCYGSVEFVARLGFSRISRIQHRMSDESMETLHIRPVENGKPSLLICGNSLLLEGVSLPLLHERLDKLYSVHRFAIESTNYLDWYFGLRRLFRQGMRPSRVVVLLATRQLMSRATRGEYFAHFLMSPRDIVDVKEQAGLDMTTASNYFLATQSSWLGAQSEIRKWLLGRVFPDFSDMIGALRPSTVPLPSDQEIGSVVPAHLTALRDLCQRYASRLVLVIPPSAEDVKTALIQEYGQSTNVTVRVPYRTLPALDFSDGFHLNSLGNPLFTEALAKDLAGTTAGENLQASRSDGEP